VATWERSVAVDTIDMALWDAVAKIGNGIAEDRPRIEGVLAEMDSKAQLAVDANGRLTLEDAIA
jgi:L-alanine-DL-glutamate epimerase-like enolase superfamily enzyme